jgi:hypothetical protein
MPRARCAVDMDAFQYCLAAEVDLLKLFRELQSGGSDWVWCRALARSLAPRALGDAGQHARICCLFVRGSRSLARSPPSVLGDAGQRARNCCLFVPVLGSRSLARSARALGDAGQHARNDSMFVLGSRSLARSPLRWVLAVAGQRARNYCLFVPVLGSRSLARSARALGDAGQYARKYSMLVLALARSLAPMAAGRSWASRSQCLSVRPGLSLTPSHSKDAGQHALNLCLFVPMRGTRSLARPTRRWATRS